MKLTITKLFAHLEFDNKRNPRKTKDFLFPICPVEGQSAFVYLITCKYIQNPYLGVGGTPTSFHPKDLSYMGAWRLKTPLEGQQVGEEEKKSERRGSQLQFNPFQLKAEILTQQYKLTILYLGGRGENGGCTWSPKRQRDPSDNFNAPLVALGMPGWSCLRCQAPQLAFNSSSPHSTNFPS